MIARKRADFLYELTTRLFYRLVWLVTHYNPWAGSEWGIRHPFWRCVWVCETVSNYTMRPFSRTLSLRLSAITRLRGKTGSNLLFQTVSRRKAPCKRTQHCWPTTPNIIGCYMLRPFAHLVSCCWMLLRVVVQSLKPIKLFSLQLPTYLLFCDRRTVAQQCWIRLHNSSNIVGAAHAHCAWFTKTYGLYPSHDALQVLTLLGVVASVCTPLRPFARSLTLHNSKHRPGLTRSRVMNG